jgi:hypothetical protein
LIRASPANRTYGSVVRRRNVDHEPSLPIAPEDFERLARLLQEQEWIFAKTMPENPHHYTLRRKWTDHADFVWAVETIRRHGYCQKYKKNWYRVLDVHDHFYWTNSWRVHCLPSRRLLT